MPKKPQKPLLLTFDLERCTPEALSGLLKEPQTDGRLLDQIAKIYFKDAGILNLLVMHPKIFPQTLLYLFNLAPPELKKNIQKLRNSSAAAEKALVPLPGSVPATADSAPVADLGEDHRTSFQRIQSMTVAEKVQFALRAGKDVRSILLKDPNRLVAMAVLNSPKITEDEVQLIAQSRNVSDEILRGVGSNKEWMKNYSILYALASNPKTPLGISMPLIPMIKAKDLGILAKNRNVPEAIRTIASRFLSAKNKQG